MGSTASAAPPPEPARPEATAASSSGSTPMPASAAETAPAPAGDSTTATTAEGPQQELRTALIRSEEYCEIDSMPHFKRSFTDGTVEYEPW